MVQGVGENALTCSHWAGLGEPVALWNYKDTKLYLVYLHLCVTVEKTPVGGTDHMADQEETDRG